MSDRLTQIKERRGRLAWVIADQDYLIAEVERLRGLSSVIETKHYADEDGASTTHRIKLEHSQHATSGSDDCPVCQAVKERDDG